MAPGLLRRLFVRLCAAGLGARRFQVPKSQRVKAAAVVPLAVVTACPPTVSAARACRGGFGQVGRYVTVAVSPL